MSWERWWDQARQVVEDRWKDTRQGPVSEKVAEQIAKSVGVAMEWGQRVPSQEEIVQILEEKNPQLAQVFLNSVHEVSNPYQVGMGLKIEQLDHTVCRVRLPHRWRNRGSSGALHSGALSTLAEYTARSFWQHQVDEKLAKLTLKSSQARFLSSGFYGVTALLNIAGEERERQLFELHSRGEVELCSPVVIFGPAEQRVAEFDLQWQLKSPLAMESQAPEVGDV